MKNLRHRATTSLPGPERAEAAREAVAETTRWLYGTLMKPHPDLGRNGAVCPYLDSATKAGRVSLNVVHVDSESAFPRLAATAADWLDRIRGAGDTDGSYESVLFLPVGAPDPVLVECVRSVQRQLRVRAVERGCMAGEFFPGHPAPGVHNPDYRPLAAPWPVLGIRSMVESDILFLGQRSEAVKEWRHGVETWHRFFARRAAPQLLDAYWRAKSELDAEPRTDDEEAEDR